MSPSIPRLRPITPEEHLRNALKAGGSASVDGRTPDARPVRNTPRATPYQAGGNVLTGIQGGADVVSITSTTAGTGTSEADADQSVAVGLGVYIGPDATEAVAVGPTADVEAFRGVAIGSSAFVDTGADLGVAVGAGAHAGGDSSIAIGNSDAGGARGVSIGAGAAGNGTQGCVAIGAASAGGDNDVAVGDTAIADGTDGSPTGEPAATCVGFNTFAAAASTSVGAGASCNGVLDVAVGRNATTNSSDHATAVGADTVIDIGCHGAVAIGSDHTGLSAHATAQDAFVLGTSNHNVQVPGRLNVARHTPTGSADSQGAVGDITSDDSFIYVKTSAGWKRAALSTF